MWEVGVKENKSFSLAKINRELENLKGDLTVEESQVALAKFLYANPFFAIQLLTGVEIYPYQELILRAMICKDYGAFILGRGCAKSYTLALFIPLYAIFNPGKKIVITSKTARQSRLIFQQIEKFSLQPEGKLLKDCIKEVKRPSDGWHMTIGSSEIISLPLGTSGDLIRGLRAHVLIVDEFLLLDENVFNTIIRPFMLVKQDPTKRDKIVKSEDYLISKGLLKESDRTYFESNKLIITSSASYKFQYLYKLYERYINLITGRNRDLVEKEELKHISHTVFKMSYKAVPESLLDQAGIQDALRQMSNIQFRRELESEFIDDSGGYYSAEKMFNCTIPIGEKPTVLLAGIPGKKYILAVDPNYSSADSSDHFAMSLIEVDVETKKAVLVHCYFLSKATTEERSIYLRYLYDHFDIVFTICDHAGGPKFFEDAYGLQALSKPFKKIDSFDLEDEEDFREFKKEWQQNSHILYSQYFSTKWIMEANQHLQVLIDQKNILFAAPIHEEDDLKKAMAIKIPIDRLVFQPSGSKIGEMKKMELIDWLGEGIDLTIKECSLIEITTNSTGGQTFDLPKSLANMKSSERIRKDSYSTLLLSCWAMKIYFMLVDENFARTKKRNILIPRFLA